MIRFLVRFAALLAACILAAAPLPAQQYPAEPGDGLADMAGIIDPAEADSLRRMIATLRTEVGVEVHVLTVQNIAHFGTNDPSPEAFATAVYNNWMLGYGQAQGGVLVLVSVDDRFARIELGDGVLAHLDARMQAIMDADMVPQFREGNYEAGIMDGVRAISTSLRYPVFDALPQPTGGYSDPQTAYGQPSSGVDGDTRMVAVLIGLLILVCGVMLGPRYLRHRKLSCGECGQPMKRLDETVDDVYLDSGRRLEEVLGSVNYGVWKCTSCNHHQVRPYAAMSSRKQDCPSCGYRTVTVTARMLQRATYDHTGREQVERDCSHCAWRDVDIIHLPREARPSSYSDSLFSSDDDSSPRKRPGGGWSGGGWSGGFGSRRSGGGGSSSGHGASGRW